MSMSMITSGRGGVAVVTDDGASQVVVVAESSLLPVVVLSVVQDIVWGARTLVLTRLDSIDMESHSRSFRLWTPIASLFLSTF